MPISDDPAYPSYASLVGALGLVPTSEQGIEGRRRQIGMSISRCPHHSAAYLSHTLRLDQLQKALENDEACWLRIAHTGQGHARGESPRHERKDGRRRDEQ